MKYVITGLLLLFSSVAFANGYDVYIDTSWGAFNDAPEEPGEYVGLKIRDGRFFCERIKKEVEEKSTSSYTPPQDYEQTRPPESRNRDNSRRPEYRGDAG